MDCPGTARPGKLTALSGVRGYPCPRSADGNAPQCSGPDRSGMPSRAGAWSPADPWWCLRAPGSCAQLGELPSHHASLQDEMRRRKLHPRLGCAINAEQMRTVDPATRPIKGFSPVGRRRSLSQSRTRRRTCPVLCFKSVVGLSPCCFSRLRPQRGHRSSRHAP